MFVSLWSPSPWSWDEKPRAPRGDSQSCGDLEPLIRLGSRSHYLPRGGEEHKACSLGDSRIPGQIGEGHLGALAPRREILGKGSPPLSSIHQQH